MEFQYDKLRDPQVFGEGCMEPHSDHPGGCTRLDLNGLWRFHYARNYAGTIRGFQNLSHDCEGWNRIRVPGHIQLQGYDRPQYVNTQYPWEGHEELVPGQIPTEFNPVASYVRSFTLPESMEGLRTFLVLEGAESAAAVWLNGDYLGYHEDSFTPAEWEITGHLRQGENRLAVQVFKWCLGSWCEDQDFFRFSGLYRDVYLYSVPRTHVRDLDIRATPSEDLGQGDFFVKARVWGTGSVTLELKDGEKTVYKESKTAEENLDFHTTISHPHLWSAEEPRLYDCRIIVTDGSGNFCETVTQKVGFRRFEIKNGLMCLNGKRIVFNGVNRHEFCSRRGRCLTEEDIRRDLVILKQNNINAIRTSHYPNSSPLYRLCDELGLYLMDETNLESHGTWDFRPEDPDYTVPGDHMDWQAMLLARARAMYERDKNHPSVLIWSCGNESFGGRVIWNLSQFFRQRDDTRLVHYEGIFHDRRYPDTADMESQMYTPVAKIREFLRDHPEKPFLCCEYSHAMGNSCGGLWKYTELTRQEPRYQGGFLWDFADQALWARNRFGETFLAYGGDFGDRPTDGSFSGNGLVTGDRRLTPKMQEVKYLYQPMGIRVFRDRVEITNRNLFVSTARWSCRVQVERNGIPVETAGLDTDVEPGMTRVYPLKLQAHTEPGTYAITVSFHLRQKEAWGEAGREVAFGQTFYDIEDRKEAPACPFRVIHSPHNIGIRGENFEVLFSLLSGGPVSYRWGGRELLEGMPRPNFWRAPTDNDRGSQMAARYGQWKLASLYFSRNRVTDKESQGLEYTLKETPEAAELAFRYWLPSNPEAFCTVTYRVYGSGRISVALDYDPVPGLPPMPEFGMLLRLPPEFSRVQWYGLGPADTYWDRRMGGRLGLYQNRVGDDLAFCLVPQECGNKEQVRFATVTDDRGTGLRFDAENPAACCFSALPYTPHQLELADHVYELPRPVHTVVRLALARMGVGGDDSWGARTHAEYLLPNDRPLHFSFSFRGIG